MEQVMGWVQRVLQGISSERKEKTSINPLKTLLEAIISFNPEKPEWHNIASSDAELLRQIYQNMLS